MPFPTEEQMLKSVRFLDGSFFYPVHWIEIYRPGNEAERDAFRAKVAAREARTNRVLSLKELTGILEEISTAPPCGE